MVVYCLLVGRLIAIASCDDPIEPTTPFPPSTIGVIQGQVRIAGRAVAIGVGARKLQSPGTIVAQTRSDASGRYRLALPPATYRIELDPRSGLGYTSSDMRDTVRVAAGVRILDLVRGTLTAHVAIPLAPNGMRFSLALEPSLPFPSLDNVSAAAQDGRLEFEFPIVSPGTYRLRLRSEGADGFWLPGTGDQQSADAVVVGAEHATVYETRLRNYAVISGTIRGGWLEAGAFQPRVEAYTLAGREIDRARSAEDGSFTLMIFDVQPVRLQVSITGIDQWVGGDTFESATTFRLQRQQHLEGVSVLEGGIICELEGPGLLAGYRAQVVLHEESGRTYEPFLTYEDPILICNLRSGSYRLYVHGDCDSDGEPWASQWYDNADSMAAATSIEVVEGHATRVRMRLDHDGRIEGRVLDSTGQLSPAVLAVFRGGTPLCHKDLRYIGSESFSIRGLGNGDYTLAALVGGALWWYPGSSIPESAGILRIRNHGTLSGIEWRLPPLNAGGRP